MRTLRVLLFCVICVESSHISSYFYNMMTNFWLQVADRFFVVFHLFLTLFNVLGWMWKKTRRQNLLTLLLTGGSWGILGIFYGFGYCPLTDWHWKVLNRLGIYNLPPSYLEYLAERLTGAEFETDLVNHLTLLLFLVVILTSGVLNLRDYLRKKQARK